MALETILEVGDKILTDNATVTVAARQKICLRYQVADEWVDVLDEKVPAGKQWAVTYFFQVTETDA